MFSAIHSFCQAKAGCEIEGSSLIKRQKEHSPSMYLPDKILPTPGI